MPYDLLTKAGEFSALAIILAALIKLFFDWMKRQDTNYSNLVSKIMEQSKTREEEIKMENKDREDKLSLQLDKYNTSLERNTDCLKQISENIKSIPEMQKDIEILKEKVK